MNRILFYSGHNNPHLTPIIQAFDKLSRYDSAVIVEDRFEKHRKGLVEPDLSKLDCIELFRGKTEFFKALQKLYACDIFFGHSFFYSKTSILFFFIGAFLRKRIFFVSEPFNPYRCDSLLMATIKKLLLFLLRFLAAKSSITILAQGGERCVTDYASYGFNVEALNFGYAVEYEKIDSSEINFFQNEIVYVGSLIERKNILDLVLGLKNSHINFKLKIVGDGPLKDKLLTCIKGDVRFEYLGKIKEKEKIYTVLDSSDYLLLGSYFDGWGAVVNEAMCRGLAVILSNNVYSGVELLEDGVNGFKFDPNNIAEFVKLVEKANALTKADVMKLKKQSLIIISSWTADSFAKNFNEYLTDKRLAENGPFSVKLR